MRAPPADTSRSLQSQVNAPWPYTIKPVSRTRLRGAGLRSHFSNSTSMIFCMARPFFEKSTRIRKAIHKSTAKQYLTRNGTGACGRHRLQLQRECRRSARGLQLLSRATLERTLSDIAVPVHGENCLDTEVKLYLGPARDGPLRWRR